MLFAMCCLYVFFVVRFVLFGMCSLFAVRCYFGGWWLVVGFWLLVVRCLVFRCVLLAVCWFSRVV